MTRSFETPPAVVVEIGAYDLAQLVTIDQRVDKSDTDAIIARWEFGRVLLAERERNGGKQLPNGRLTEVCNAVGKSTAEIRNRIQFASEYNRDEVANALATYGTWHEICANLGRRAEPPPPPPPPPAPPRLGLTEPGVLPRGEFIHFAIRSGAYDPATGWLNEDWKSYRINQHDPYLTGVQRCKAGTFDNEILCATLFAMFNLTFPVTGDAVPARSMPTLQDVPWDGPIHEACKLMPMVSWDELETWADSIRDHGLLHPIVVTEAGELLDGKLRLIACQLAGVDPRFETFIGDEAAAVAYVISMNIQRQHHTQFMRTLAEVSGGAS